MFYYDNGSPDKFYYLLLSELKAKDSIVLYDRFKRLKSKRRDQILKSTIFSRLFESEKYQPLMMDLIHHVHYHKRHKSDRIEIQIRGEQDDLSPMS